MSSASIDAGELREVLSLMELFEIEAGHFIWRAVAALKASVGYGTGRNLFSSVGIGARDVKLLVRRQSALQPGRILLWQESFLFVSAVLPKGTGYLELSAAEVDPVSCSAEHYETRRGENGRPLREKVATLHFPGILTEKFLGYHREDSHAVATETFVLVVPKVLTLETGDLVRMEGGPVPGGYNVQKCHRLDKWKNEYEIVKRSDV